jgi:multicomponent Na+:H+ antiporter subunit B
LKVAFGSRILDAATRLLAPFIALFAAYVVCHGHISPGGGFQGGVILAAVMILVRLTRGTGAAWGLDRSVTLPLACAGVLLYLAIGLLGPLRGRNFLDYAALPLPLEPAALRALGSFGIELGVALSVTAVMVLLFDALLGLEEDQA